MKLAHKHLIAVGLLAALGATAIAQTPAVPAAPGTAASSAAQSWHGRDPARMQERMAQRLAAFKQKLNLSPGQEGAWTAYVAALTPPAFNRPDRAEFAKLSTPERIDRMRTLRAARMAEMDKRGEATKAFYAVLTTEQKKVFDDETARRGGRGHHGHHGHHKA